VHRDIKPASRAGSRDQHGLVLPGMAPTADAVAPAALSRVVRISVKLIARFARS
jgi:hypothetical protein